MTFIVNSRLVNIVDADSILYIVCYNKKDEPVKSLQEVFSTIDGFLSTMFRETMSTDYILYLTVGDGFRKQINPLYKANRKQDKPDMFDFAKEYLITKYKAVYSLGFEADDLCCSTKKILDSQGIKCFISSPDKDLKNKVGSTWDYRKKEWVNSNTEEAAYDQWGKLIWGDSSDGILGIPKKGPKYVEQLFADCHWSMYPKKVFEAYMDYYGEQGIEEMYKVYKVLKILDEIPGFVLPDLQEVKSGYQLYKEETNEKED